MATPVEDPTKDLPPFPSRQQLVNVDRTATKEFIRWVEQWLKHVKTVSDALVEGDIPAGDVTPGTIDIEDLVDQFRREVGVIVGYDGAPIHGRIKELRDQIEALAVSVASMGGQVNSWNVSVNARIGANEASFSDHVLTFVTDSQAFAQELVTLESTFTTNYNTATAAIATEATTRADADGALGVLVTEVATSYDDVSANGFARFEITTTAAGATASYQVALRASANGVTYDGGMRLDLISDGGGAYHVRMFCNVEEFIIGDATHTIAPFYVSGGIVRIDIATIADLIADNIAVKSLDADEILVDGTLITDLLADNAAIKVASVVTAATALNITTATQVQSLAFTPSDGKLLVTASAKINVVGAASGTITVILKRAGTTVVSIGTEYVLGQGNIFTIYYEDPSPGTSSVTWTMEVECLTGGGANARAGNRYIQCLNAKKQA